MSARAARAGLRVNILIAGMLAGDPFQGGATWAVLQYVLGLRQLGHDVVVVDPLPGGAIPPETATYFDEVCTAFGLTGRAALMPHDEGVPRGMDADALRACIRRSTVLVNLSGRWRDHEAVAGVPVRVYVDLDPGFTQLWHHQGADVGLGHHTHHVTVGGAMARAGHHLPTSDVSWRAMLPPVVLDAWPVASQPSSVRLSTVANWRSYGSIEHDGVHYGQKAHSFRRLERLPAESPLPLDVALSIHDGDRADRDRLATAGWGILDPCANAGDPGRYQRFVQSSWAEIGVAKTGYVAGRTGWVSDRTACYLASGRPAVVQDTGLADVLPLGRGLLTFEGVDDAADAIGRVQRDYRGHREAARSLAESHFDSRRVLGGLLSDVTA